MRNRTEVPRAHCPDCDHVYPPGTIISPDDSTLDPVAESGGPSHEAECPGNSQPGSLGMFQAMPGTWG